MKTLFILWAFNASNADLPPVAISQFTKLSECREQVEIAEKEAPEIWSFMCIKTVENY